MSQHRQTISNVGHLALDGAGFIPVIGTAADVVNGTWYAAEGDWTNAACSLGAAVPIVGDAVAAGRKATKIADAANAVRGTRNTLTTAGDSIKTIQASRSSTKQLQRNQAVGRATERAWTEHFESLKRSGSAQTVLGQTTLKSPSTKKTLEPRRRRVDNFIDGIVVEIKATPWAARSSTARAQKRLTQKRIKQGTVVGNKKDGYHAVKHEVTKVGLPILGPGGNTGPHFLRNSPFPI